MIKFFRNIRQTLINEGKTSRYFKYAIGEIVLVVIGILIALQINNWNQERLEAIEEQKILKNLKIDFENNNKILESAIVETKEGIHFCLEMLKYTGNKSKPSTAREFDSILNRVFVTPGYFPVNGTLEEIMNSGKLGILRNEDLRKLLSVWPAIIETVQSRYEATNDNEDFLNHYMLQYGNWLNADEVTAETRSIVFPKSGFETDNRNLLNDLQFENLIENVAIGLDNYLTRLVETSQLLNDIYALINSEIIYD